MNECYSQTRQVGKLSIEPGLQDENKDFLTEDLSFSWAFSRSSPFPSYLTSIEDLVSVLRESSGSLSVGSPMTLQGIEARMMSKQREISVPLSPIVKDNLGGHQLGEKAILHRCLPNLIPCQPGPCHGSWTVQEVLLQALEVSG